MKISNAKSAKFEALTNGDIDEKDIIRLPQYVKTDILEKTRILSKHVEVKKENHYEKLLFRLKFGVATCGALVILYFCYMNNSSENISVNDSLNRSTQLQQEDTEESSLDHFLEDLNNKTNDFTNTVSKFLNKLVSNK